MKFNKKLFSIFFIGILTILLVACGGTTTTTETPTTVAPTTQAPTTVAPTTQAPTTVAPTTTEAEYDFSTLEAALKAHYADTIDSDTYVTTEDLVLITTLQDATITWASSNHTYLSDSGVITRPSFTEGNKTVILTATIAVGNQTKNVTFFVEIGKLDKTDQERANEVLGFVTTFPFQEFWTEGDSDDLTFITEADDNDDVTYTVVWSSSHPDIISTAGVITQPEDADVTVTMTATVTINSVEFSETVTFLVAKYSAYTEVESIDAAKELLIASNPSLSYLNTEYVLIPGLTVIAISDFDTYFTDGVDIISVYKVFDDVEVGDVYDVTAEIQISYLAWQLTSSSAKPFVYEVSELDASNPPKTVAATLQEIFDDNVQPAQEADKLMSKKMYTVTAKIYYEESWGNYGVFLVPLDYDFETNATKQTSHPRNLPDTTPILIYYPSDEEVLRAFHGKEVTIDIILHDYRTDFNCWSAVFLGDASDVQTVIEDDAEAVAMALAALTFPEQIIEDSQIDIISSLYGVTLTYTSSNPTAINVTTGAISITGLTEPTSITLTVDAERGTAEDSKVFTILVGPLVIQDIADVYDAEADDLIKIKGILTTDVTSYQYFFQDATGGISLDPDAFETEFASITLGSEIEITGTVGLSNGLYEFTVLDYEVTATTPALPTPVDISAIDFTDTALLPYQGQMVGFIGFVLAEAPSADKYGTYTFTLVDIVNEKEISVMLDNRSNGYDDAKTELLTLEAGDEVVITGAILGWDNGYELIITNASQFSVGTNGLTEAQKLAADVDNMPEMLTLDENYVIPTGNFGTTFTVDSIFGNASNYIDYTTTPGTLLVTRPYGTDATAVITFTAENGEEEFIGQINVVVDSISINPIATDLFISEYGEGSSYNKWLEIYNGTGADVDLSDYTIELYSNGSTEPNTTYGILNLTGTLADGDVYVIYDSQASDAIKALGDVSSSAVSFNGDDAVVLKKDGVIIDIILEIGHTKDDKVAENLTWIRKSSILSGNAVFDATEWTEEAQDYIDDLGSHTVDTVDLTDAIKVLVDKAALDLDGTAYAETTITLPVLGSVFGSTIEWAFKTDAGTNATLVGNVLTLNAVETDTQVVVEATLTLGEGETLVTEKATFTYLLTGSTDAERVAADKAELIAKELDEDLYIAIDVVLPTSGSYGSDITWEITTDADEMATLDEAGNTVSFLNAMDAEATVVLTGTISYGETATDTITVTYTLKAYPVVDLENFTTLSDGDIVVVSGYVYAVITGGIFVQDATGNVFVDTYNSTVTYNVGDQVFLTGEVDVWSGFYKLAYLLETPEPSTTGNDVTQTAVEYIPGTTTLEFGETYTVQGTVAIEGDHSNVFIYLNETDKIEIYHKSPTASIDALEALVGKEIVLNVLFYDGTRFAYVGGTEGYSEIITDFSVLYTKTDGTNFDIAINDYVYLNGIVTGISSDGVFIQDANGVGFFMYHPDGEDSLNLGDEVIYYGKVAEYKNVRQLNYGADQIDVRTTGNIIHYNSITADQMAEFAIEDAGSAYTYTGFVYQGFTTFNEMIFEYTLSDGTTKESLYINSGQHAKWLFFVPDMFEEGDVLPAVDFHVYQTDYGKVYLDVINVAYSDDQAIEYDAVKIPATLELTSDYEIPEAELGSIFTVTAVSAGLDAFIDESTPGTLIVTRPEIGQADAVGTVTIQVTNGEGTAVDKVIDVTVKANVDPSSLTEQVVYSTGFESPDFTASSSYNNNTEALSGPTGFQWATRYGTPSTTSAIIGSQSMQMRWYREASGSHTTDPIYTYTNFATSEATKITFYAANATGMNVEVTISVDGGTTWIAPEVFILTTTSTQYTYNVPVENQTSNVMFKFTIVVPDPMPTSDGRLYLDDVEIYGMR